MAKQSKPTRLNGSGKHLPRQGWTITEKFDFLNALLADQRFSYGERVASAYMASYYHNTTTGDLYPSRKQVHERCGVVGILSSRPRKK
jgi:hypothetical protein